MPNNSDLEALLDAIDAQMPRFRQQLAQVLADIDECTGPPRPAAVAALEQRQPQRRADRCSAKVERAALH